MIKFFRKIRQNLLSEGKTGKYLKYAVGEIVLVVIGILIALQINNWNEHRKAKTQEKNLVLNLTEDLVSDKERFAFNLKETNDILNVYKQLYEIGANKKKDSIIDNPNYVRKLLKFSPNMNQDYATLSDKITNDEIRESLLLYDWELNNFEAEFSEFQIVIERIRIFLGEKGKYKLEGLYNTDNMDNAIYLDKDQLIPLAKTVEFQQLMFEAKLKLEYLKIRLLKILKQNAALNQTIEKNIVLY